MTFERKPLDAGAFALMTLLCALWGAQQVTIKVAAPDVSLVAQGAIRSIIATVLVFAWARVRGIALFDRDGTLWSGLAAGFMFGAEFAFVYAGLGHTTASRMVVFIYLTPVLTALGLTLFVPGERLRPVQWAGVLLAFSGVVAAFREGFTTAGGATWIGDLCGIIAAVLWAATIVLIRATRLAVTSATKVLFYQLAFSAAMLPLVSLAMGEPGVVRLTPAVVAILAYQGVIVAFASYLAWFWLLTKYLAARLSVFSFLTPLFGIVFGVVFLDDPVSPAFLTAAALVLAGIVFVNLPAAHRIRERAPSSGE